MSVTGLAFLAAFVTGQALAFTRHPMYGLVTYVGVFYLHPPSRWWGQGWMADVRWSLIAAAATMVAVLLRKTTIRPPPRFGSGLGWGLACFVLWLAVQSAWAVDSGRHGFLLSLFAKYLVLVFLMFRCIESEKHLKMFLWSHVLGCLYLAWLANAKYTGGRFEGFGGPGLDDANSAANQLASGILVASALFLAGRLFERTSLFLGIPAVVNALVITISRSGFLALVVGGLIFNLFTPARFRVRVLVLSLLALLLLGLVTGPGYWERMQTIKYAGEQVEGVDTGEDRLEIVKAQWRMFQSHPLGCGHRCTEYLAPSYLDKQYLTVQGSRSSHNTFMSLLVEQGIPGALFYLAMLAWICVMIVRQWRILRKETGFLASAFPAVAATLVAVVVGDMFVDFLRHELRIWFLALLVVMQELALGARGQPRPDGEPQTVRGSVRGG